jgi:hypothetical protein
MCCKEQIIALSQIWGLHFVRAVQLKERQGSSALFLGPECSINFLGGSFKCNDNICIMLIEHLELQTKTGPKTQCKSCCNRNVTIKNQEFQRNSWFHFAIKSINFEPCTWLYNKYKQQQNSLQLFKYCTILFIQKCWVPHNKLLSITLAASMLSLSSDDSSEEKRQWKICDKSTGEAMARKQICKVWNWSAQKGTANPPSRNPSAAQVQQIPQAEIHSLLLDLLDPFRPTHFVGYLDNLMSVLGISEGLGNS